MAIQPQPSRIPEPFAGSGTKNTIPATNSTPSASQAASWASGFPSECSLPVSAGGCPVPRNDFNGIVNALSQHLVFAQDGGVWEWSATADYGPYRLVLGSDHRLYFSKAQSGPGTGAGAHNPVNDTAGTYWGSLPIDVSGYAGDVAINGNKSDLAGANRGLFGALLGVNVFPNGVDLDSIAKTSVYDMGVGVPMTHNPASNGLLVTLSSGFGNGTRKQLWMRFGTIGSTDYQTFVRTGDPNGYGNWYEFVVYDHVKTLLPDTDNSADLGSASYRYKQVFAATGTINTSDEREKASIEAFPDAVLDAWGDVGFLQFQMQDAVEEKGADAARIHSGLVAQRIDAAFKAHGLDASRYGLFCRDVLPAREERRDEDGTVVQASAPESDRCGVRYEEALCMEAAYQRRRADRAEARLAALEERLAAIEAKLG